MIAYRKPNREEGAIERTSLQEEIASRHGATVQRFASISAKIIGLAAALFVILARDGVGPNYFEAVGKALFWTGMTLVPLLNFNRDVLRFPAAIALFVALSVCQMIAVVHFFGKLESVNIISLTLLSFIQCLIFFVPFMFIRRRLVGIWY